MNFSGQCAVDASPFPVRRLDWGGVLDRLFRLLLILLLISGRNVVNGLCDKQLPQTANSEITSPSSPEPSQRAAVISVSLEESIIALGAWDNIISLPHTSSDNVLVQRLKLPEKDHTTFSNAGNFNFESMFRMNPDLVLTWVGNDALISRLASLHIPTVTVHPHNREEIVSMLGRLGKALGREQRARRLTESIEAISADLAALSPERPTRVLWLGGTRTLVYGKKWLFHDLIQRAGGVDVTADLAFEPWVAELSVEQIVAMNPEVIIIGGWAPYEPEDLWNDPRWASIDAVKTKRVFKTPAGRANFSPYAALMALMAAHWCHPDHFPAVSLLKALNTYHRKFYGIGFADLHPDFARKYLNTGEP
jgi:iron complex transport system substrate-binding protein